MVLSAITLVNLQSRLQCGDRRNKSKRTPCLPERRGEGGAIAPHRGDVKAIEEAPTSTEVLRSELDQLPRTRPAWSRHPRPSDPMVFHNLSYDMFYK